MSALIFTHVIFGNWKLTWCEGLSSGPWDGGEEGLGAVVAFNADGLCCGFPETLGQKSRRPMMWA